MAKRRALHRALSGLGEGLGQASSYLFRQTQQERMQDRYDERQAKTQEAIDARTAAGQKAMADRAEEAATRTAILGILDKLSAGDSDPEQAAATLAMLTKSNVDPASLEGMRPSTHRRLSKQFDESISKATSPEGVPTDDDVLTFARGDSGMKIPGALDEMSGDPFGPFRPEVRAKSEQAGAKRRSLTAADTDLIDTVDPVTGEPRKQRVQKRGPEMTGGMSVGPTSAQAAALEGAKQNTIENLTRQGKAKTAGAVSGASKTAEINAQMANASKIIDFETKKALAAIQTAGSEVEVKEWGKQIADARLAANSVMPVIGQLRLLWEKAQPQIEAMASKNSEVLAQVEQGTLPRSLLPTDVRKYLDFLEAARPRLARAMGNVGNFTEGEQARAGYIAPDFIDGVNGGVTGYDKLDRIEQLVLAAPSIAQRNRPGSKPMTGDEINAIVAAQRRAKQGDVELQAPTYDILLTPSGTQVRRPGAQQ